MAIVFIILAMLMNTPGAVRPGPEALPAPAAGADSVFQVGEDLVYNVSYAMFDIGQVRIKVLERTGEGGHPVHKAIAYLDSYKGVPFVSLHVTYESAVTDSFYSMWFRSKAKDDTHWRTVVYDFNYPAHRLFITGGIQDSAPLHRDTLKLDTLTEDGLSLFFYARANVRDKKKVSVPTVVNEKNVTTNLDFIGERTGEKIDAVDYPIDVLHFEGQANFVGVFGFSGGFEGWFSNDAEAVPVVVKMKVLIGNIRIELVRWNRERWTPPRAAS